MHPTSPSSWTRPAVSRLPRPDQDQLLPAPLRIGPDRLLRSEAEPVERLIGTGRIKPARAPAQAAAHSHTDRRRPQARPARARTPSRHERAVLGPAPSWLGVQLEHEDGSLAAILVEGLVGGPDSSRWSGETIRPIASTPARVPPDPLQRYDLSDEEWVPAAR